MSLSPEDRLDIQDLLVRYEYMSHGLIGDENSLLELFTDDVVLDGPRGYHEGTEGVMEYARQVRPTDVGVKARTRLTNFLIEGDGDDATMLAAFVRIKAKTDDGRPQEMVTGSYDCVAKKVDGVWKLKHRIIRIDGLPQFRDTPEYEAGARYVLRGDQFVLEGAK